MKNFTDLTKYPVGTKVRNRAGQSGWICLIKQGKDGSFVDNHPVVVEIETEDGIKPYSCKKDGGYYIPNIDTLLDIVEIVVDEIDLTKYPVGTKVKTKWGEGTIFDIREGYTHCIGVDFGRSLTYYFRPHHSIEIIVDEIDLSTCQIGNRLLCRNGGVVVYLRSDRFLLDYLIHTLQGTDGSGLKLYTDGSFYSDRESGNDIIQILPQEEKQTEQLKSENQMEPSYKVQVFVAHGYFEYAVSRMEQAMAHGQAIMSTGVYRRHVDENTVEMHKVYKVKIVSNVGDLGSAYGDTFKRT